MDATKRLLNLRNYMSKNELDMCIITNPANQYYISGLKALLYSRPIVLTVREKETDIVIPALEENHAKDEAKVDNIYVYYEHPEKADKGILYIEHLDSIINKFPLGTRFGVEFNNIPLGLSKYLKEKGYKLFDISKKIKNMIQIKDEYELDLLKKSGELVSHALSESIKHARVGISEIEFDSFGNKAFLDMISLKYPGATVDAFSMTPSGLKRTNMPHVFSNTRKFQKNDIVIHSRQVGLNSYHAECERTFFIGEPNVEQKKAFITMYNAQQACLDFVKAGVKAKDVDAVGRKVLQKSGYGKYAIHRIGHGIGIGSHEEPYLRFDSDLTLKENMVFSIEPGIYIPGLGGFRHSDTVIVKKKGVEIITSYPREFESLIF